MLGLEGMGDVDAADREASFRLPAQRPADLPNGTELRPAQVLVGAEPLPRPGEIEPGEDESGERKQPGQDSPANEVDLEIFERLFRDRGSEDRKSVVKGKTVSVSVDLGGGRTFTKK